MKPRERIVIYSVLALVLALNLSSILGLISPSAIAEPSLFADELGPAASLTLIGEDDPLVVRNEAGRLAWTDNAHGRAYSVAFFAQSKAMEPLYQTEQYVEQRQELEDELRAQDLELTQRINAYQQQNAGVTPDDPRAAQVQQTFQAMVTEYEGWRKEANVRMGELTASQVEQAYRDMVAAVEVVAERMNIDIVYRFVPTADPFDAANPPQAHLATEQRLALVYPEGLDITDAVLEELSIEID